MDQYVNWGTPEQLARMRKSEELQRELAIARHIIAQYHDESPGGLGALTNYVLGDYVDNDYVE